MIDLSAIVIVQNGEETIDACLKSLSFADEIVLVDGGSSDLTIEIARKHKARIYTRGFDDFSSQRNFGLSKARGTWALFIDADEKVPKALAAEIMKELKIKK